MGGSSSSQTVGYKYHLGMHLALCHGPVDKIIRIRVDKKEAWLGECDGGQINLDAEDLFGGTKREGGVSGKVDIEMGASDQGQNSYLAGKLGALVPNFRGVCAAVLRQCYVGMNPYLKPWDFRAQRIHTRNGGEEQWYDAKAAVSVVIEAETETIWSDTVGSLSEYDLETGYADAFGVTISGHMLTQPSADEGHSTIAKAVVLDFVPTVVEFKVRLNTLPASADDCGELTLHNQEGTRIFGFGAGRESSIDSLNRPIVCGQYSCSSIDSVMGDAHLVVGRTYQFRGEVSGISMVCTLHDTSTGELFASKTVEGAILDGPSTAYLAELKYSVDHVPTASPNDGGAGSSEFWDLRLSAPVIVMRADMNPAHIVRECLTDLDWGMGYQDADIDDTAFMAAADTLHAEEMGISLLWDRQIPIEDFVREILRHIDAVLYVDRTTGKFVLKLIRDDYDPESLLVLDPANVEHIDAFKAPALGELVNSVTVKYWDAVTGEDASLSVQDIALVQIQGSAISATSDYPGFTHGALAARVAARDLRALSTPLVSCTLYANRAAAGLNVGDVFRLDWPDYGVASLIMRVTQIALGDGRNNQVRVTCVQDVFGLPLAIHAAPSASEWSAPDLVPSPSLHHLAVEAPYYELVQRLGQSTVDGNLAERQDLGYLLVAGDRQGVDLNARILVDAGAGYVDAGAMDFSPYAALAADVGHTDESWSFTGGVDLDQVEEDTHAQIGTEIVRVVSVGTTLMHVRRGVLDTIPVPHAAGEMILFWDAFAATDEIEYAAGETVSAKILPSTGAATLDLADADADELTFTQRAWRPYPPGQFQVNGAYWPETIGGTDALALTWAHRDRSQQTDGNLTDYLAASIGPEAGTAYTVRVYGEQDSLVHTETALAGTAWSYDLSLEAEESGASGDGAPIPGAVLCLNMDGEDGSTTFIDDTGKTVTATGAVEIDTAQSKFGGASGYFNGGYLTVPDSADWYFDTGDFTIELWARWPANGNAIFACQDVDTSNIWFFKYFSATPRLEVGVKNAGTWVLDWHDVSWTPTDNVWHHLALTRSGNTFSIFVDGVQKGTTTSSVSFPDFSVPLKIGQTSNWSAYTTTAHFDGLRIVNGSALYTANFTPPASAPGLTDLGSGRINGRLRVELESVRYAGGIQSQYAVPTITGWDGGNWIGTLGLEDAYLYQANAGASAYTGMGLNLPYAKVAYGGSLYLAISPDGTCKTSTDGATWTNRTGAPTQVQKLAYLNGQFIALTLYDLYSTTDGITWTLKKTFAYRPLDVAYGGSTWMVVGGNKSGGNIPFASTSSDLTTWTDVSPTLTSWNGTNLLASAAAAAGTLQADFACVIYSGSAFYLGGRFVTLIGGAYTFYPLVYKYASSTFTDCCPPLQGPVSANSGFDVCSLAVVDTRIIAAGFRIAAYATLATLTYSSWTPCTVPSGTLDSWVSVAGNGTDAVLTTNQGGAHLVTADGATFTAANGVVADNPVMIGPSDGIASLQHHDHTVYRTGYGFNFGMFYGGV